MSEDTTGPDQIEKSVPIPVVLPPTVGPAGVFPTVLDSPFRYGVRHDDVGLSQARTPSELVAGPNARGVETEWDASSLDSAIDWLETHAQYLRRLSYDMAVIKERLGGDDPTASVLGGFPYAQKLTQTHSVLHSSTEQKLKSLSDSLYAAARALGTVKSNYQTAEQANAMSATEMQQAFTNAARGGGATDGGQR
ncbi:hypothetical protein [Micromonospora endolithica]|uniref:Uncharacterized protein n=1 Tax=Micromonospora endolithica TaxID=230091 RepID=A0A3A9YYG3_9ACTN|nr:hypothetical protein [Micromonospora endolithica]RKN41121.1 hypothetical protein D7223_25645 [Micromonospora endolithica]TWJ24355.1 hypothetical protein JD76_04505 [Micromonospora endolithica]